MIITFQLAAAALLTASALSEIITLVNGSSLSENSKARVLDLGYDVIRIPRPNISRREPDSANSSEGKSAQAAGIVHSPANNTAGKSVTEFFEHVVPATVQIPSSFSSGFIISPDGHLVISGEDKISVVLDVKGEKELRKITLDNVELIAQSPPGLERSISKDIVSVRNRVSAPGIILIQHTSRIDSSNSSGQPHQGCRSHVGARPDAPLVLIDRRRSRSARMPTRHRRQW